MGKSQTSASFILYRCKFFSKKGFTPADYMANAQQQALGDLASNISTNIESSSVLSVIETKYHIGENYSKEITASTSHQLEGYELVETWEDENFYWAYYRLSKSHYAKIREEKKYKVLKMLKINTIKLQNLWVVNFNTMLFNFMPKHLLV